MPRRYETGDDLHRANGVRIKRKADGPVTAAPTRTGQASDEERPAPHDGERSVHQMLRGVRRRQRDLLARYRTTLSWRRRRRHRRRHLRPRLVQPRRLTRSAPAPHRPRHRQARLHRRRIHLRCRQRFTSRRTISEAARAPPLSATWVWSSNAVISVQVEWAPSSMPRPSPSSAGST